MAAEPLTRGEREANLRSTRLTTSERDLIEHYEATVRAAEAELKLHREVVQVEREELVRQRNEAEERAEERAERAERLRKYIEDADCDCTPEDDFTLYCPRCSTLAAADATRPR